MQIQVTDFETMKYFFGMLKAVKDEFTLNVNESGIAALDMDESHVCMVDAKLLKGSVTLKDFGKEDEKICLNVKELMRFLDRIGKDETVKISYDKEKARFIIDARKGGHNHCFELPVLDAYDSECPQPKLNFAAKARIDTKALDSALRDAELVGEFIKMETKNDRFIISGFGDAGSSLSQWEKGSDELKELSSTAEDTTATYKAQDLKNWLDSVKAKSPAVIIEWSKDLPLLMTTVPETKNVEAKYYLAPCIGV